MSSTFPNGNPVEDSIFIGHPDGSAEWVPLSRAGLALEPAPVVVNGIDVTVTGITWTPAAPKVGDSVIFVATIRNNGNQAAPGTETNYTGVLFTVNGAKVSWATDDKNLVAPDEVRAFIASSGPSGVNAWKPTAAGKFTVAAFVNDVNRYAEISRENNVLEKTITVVP